MSDEEALRRIMGLPVVLEFADYPEKASGGEVHAHLRIEGAPTADAPPGSAARSWAIAVAESHPTHLVTLFRFNIDADSGAVSVYDVVEDRTLPYAEWAAREQALAVT